jgi:hypothetical protein
MFLCSRGGYLFSILLPLLQLQSYAIERSHQKKDFTMESPPTTLYRDRYDCIVFSSFPFSLHPQIPREQGIAALGLSRAQEGILDVDAWL